MVASKHWGIQTYRGHPNIWWMYKHMVASKDQWEIQTYGDIKTYMGHPNVQGEQPNIWGNPNI